MNSESSHKKDLKRMKRHSCKDYIVALIPVVFVEIVTKDNLTGPLNINKDFFNHKQVESCRFDEMFLYHVVEYIKNEIQ